MKQLIWDSCKVFIVFTVSTSIFYYGLNYIQNEYENIHRYGPPEGPSVKVFNQNENKVIDRLNLFLRLGE